MCVCMCVYSLVTLCVAFISVCVETEYILLCLCLCLLACLSVFLSVYLCLPAYTCLCVCLSVCVAVVHEGREIRDMVRVLQCILVQELVIEKKRHRATAASKLTETGFKENVST